MLMDISDKSASRHYLIDAIVQYAQIVSWENKTAPREAIRNLTLFKYCSLINEEHMRDKAVYLSLLFQSSSAKTNAAL